MADATPAKRLADKRRNDLRGAARAVASAKRKAEWDAAPAPETMTCAACKETLPFDRFAVDRRARWGRIRLCKPCKAAKSAAYANATPERRAAAVKRAEAWNARQPEYRREVIRRRRARIRSATVVPFTMAQLDARMSMFGHRCWMCGGPFEQVDHVKPVSKGGAHMLCNLRPACAACNLAKNGRWPFHHATPSATANATVGDAEPPIVHATRQ